MSASPAVFRGRIADATLEDITPKMAAEYLKQNRTNRPIGRGAIADYVSAMTAGDWMVNGDSIKFDWNGQLVDGQHRLEAIVKSGVTIRTFVTRGLDPEVFRTLDTGKKRSAADVFAIRGIDYAQAMSGAARQLYRTVQNELATKRRVSNVALDELLKGHPRFVELALETQRTPYSTDLVLQSHAMFTFYVAANVNEPRARSFFRALAGRPDPRDRVEPQAVKLRARLTSTMDEIVKPAPKIRLAWIILSWNAALHGTQVVRYSRLITEMPDWEPAPMFNRGRVAR